jgi:hypothetical protein
MDNRKERVLFVIASGRQAWMLKPFLNSLRKFHNEEELPVVVYGDAEMNAIKDPAKYYRATPMFAKELIKEYKLVIKADVDQIITGDLGYIFTKEYDVGTVYNWNRVDPPIYGEVGIATIQPIEYYNCGFVAMRNAQFINHWWGLCMSPHFERMPMREQGFLNILTHYGFYRVMCFDNYDPISGYSSWHGLRSKGEWNKIVLKGKKLILPQGADGYPEMPKQIRVLHWAGGDGAPKLDYKIYFDEKVIEYLDYLTEDKK